MDLEPILAEILKSTPEAKKGHAVPYTYGLHNPSNTKSLFFFGSRHATDPQDPIFGQLKDSLLEFKPDLVVVGDSKKADPESKINFENTVTELPLEEVIHRHSDVGFIVRLAVGQSIDWIAGRPDDEQKFRDVIESGFSPEDVFAYRLMRLLLQYQSSADPNKPNFEKYSENFLRNIAAKMNEGKVDYSLLGFEKIISHILNKEITVIGLLADKELSRYALPGNRPPGWDEPSVINQIGDVIWEYDDRIVVTKIVEAFSRYNKIFVHFGYSHAIAHEPALRKLMEEL